MPALDPLLALIAELGLGVLFLSACIHKLRAFAVFTATLEEYRLVPAPLTGAAAAATTLLEALAAIGLLSRSYVGPAMGLGLALLALYSAAIAINLLRGRRDIDCGCTGPAMRQSISEWMVVRNVLLMAAGFLAVLPVAPRQIGILDVTTAVFGVVTGALIYNAANFLIANGPKLQQLRG